MKKTANKIKNVIRKSSVKEPIRTVKNYLRQPYRIELIPIPQKEGGGYYAAIPLLKGCQSDGSTPDEAIRNLREAQRAWITSAMKHGDPIPVPQ